MAVALKTILQNHTGTIWWGTTHYAIGTAH